MIKFAREKVIYFVVGVLAFVFAFVFAMAGIFFLFAGLGPSCGIMLYHFLFVLDAILCIVASFVLASFACFFFDKLASINDLEREFEQLGGIYKYADEYVEIVVNSYSVLVRGSNSIHICTYGENKRALYLVDSIYSYEEKKSSVNFEELRCFTDESNVTKMDGTLFQPKSHYIASNP